MVVPRVVCKKEKELTMIPSLSKINERLVVQWYWMDITNLFMN